MLTCNYSDLPRCSCPGQTCSEAPAPALPLTADKRLLPALLAPVAGMGWRPSCPAATVPKQSQPVPYGHTRGGTHSSEGTACSLCFSSIPLAQEQQSATSTGIWQPGAAKARA